MDIRLLHLPHVVLREVLHSMQLIDLTFFAFSSQKSYRLVMSYRRKIPKLDLCIIHIVRSYIVVNVTLRGAPVFRFQVKPHPHRDQLVEICGDKIPLCRESSSLSTLSFNYSNPALGLKSLVNLAQDLFTRNINGVSVTKESLWLFDWINNRQQLPLAAQIFDDSEVTSDEYEHILSNSNTNTLHLYLIPPDEFRYSGPFRQRECLLIAHGRWVTIDNLLAMNCAKIVIERSRFTSFDINRFLKSWINGEMTRTEWMDAQVVDFDFETTLDGLNLEVVERIERPAVKSYIATGYGMERMFNSAYCVKHESGIQALIGHQFGIFSFCTTF